MKKGQLTISGILISFVVFILFMTVGMAVVFGDFFRNDPYSTGINTSFYSSLDPSGNKDELKGTVFSLNDNLVSENVSVTGDQNKDADLSLKSFTTLLSLRNTFSLLRTIGEDLNTKLGLPPIFLESLILVLVIIVTIALIASIRGLGRL